ncbi:HEAT repeat domain-containing protein [Verrucomicrobiaceae bacterium 227]
MKFVPVFRALTLASIFAFLATLAPAQDSGPERLNRISTSQEAPADWLWAVAQVNDPVTRESLRQALSEREEYPRKALVNLLTHPQLAVRLGALELLEQAAGSSFEFTPWSAPPVGGPAPDHPNFRSLKAWQDWAGLTGEISSTGLVLTGEQMQSYLRDVISGKAERKRRAIRMLDPHSMEAVAAIQQFIVNNPGLPASSLVSLKEAQYQLVINRTSPKSAAVAARDLTRGNRDQLLAALSALKKTGFLAIPIVRDFIDSNDALVRETAIDTILSLGGSQTVPLVTPSLKTEKDTNVIHAAMRRLREIGGDEAKEITIHYLDHESEDLVVSALETATKLWGGGDEYSRFNRSSSSDDKKEPNEVTQKVIKLLGDPRWRVRTSALEFISKTSAHAAGDKIITLLSDEDSFVRANAIDAVVSLDLKSATPALQELFLNDDDMIGPVTAAFTSLETVLPDPLIAHLDTRSPDAIIAAIKGLNSDDDPFLKIVARYATHSNLDVSCTALRALGSDYDNVKKEFVANHLSEALQSGVEEKISAILNSLSFPSPHSNSGFGYSNIILPPSQPTTLDHLYDAFLRPGKPDDTPDNKPVPTQESTAIGGKEGLQVILANIAGNWDANPEDAYRAAFILARADDGEGLAALLTNFDKLTTSQRAAVADNLYSPQHENSIPLLVRLMQDELSEVRTDAAYAAFGSSKLPNLFTKSLEQLTIEDSSLAAHEAYGYGLESSLTRPTSAQNTLSWARDLLTSEARDDNKILALILLRGQLREGDDPTVTRYTRSKNQWLRRAAWHALCTARIPWVIDNVDTLLEDPSPQVRVALPMTLGNESRSWIHKFSDLHSKSDSESESSDSKQKRLPDDLEKTLRKLAAEDADSRVRFESWFALMSHRKEIDLRAFLSLIGEQSEEAHVGDRLANHLERNYLSMGSAMRPLLAFTTMKEISGSKLPAILKHFSTNEEGSSFTSFEALAKSTATTAGPQQLDGVETPEEIARKRTSLKVIAFYKPGCRECEKAEKSLADLKQSFPLLTVERLNIIEQKGLLVNQALCDRLKVSGVGKTPSFFTQAGAAISPNIRPEQLSDLLRSTMEIKDDPTWADFDEVEMDEAKEKIDESFSNVTLAIVIFGGLLDGINPCAFATIIFFLSYLQLARRTPREILMVGISFIAAIFLAYFSVGLIFHAAIEKLVELESFQIARVIMTWVFAFFALLVAVLSLRDGIRASRGSLKDMSLQLPEFLKNRIRGAIRKRARARNYVIAAFITGIVISFLELACTGQVYAPIVYQIQQGRSDAVLYLLIYNIAFILPLVVIFILAYRGMTSDALVRFQKNHTAAVKYATAILFFVLTFIILFGDKILPHG